MPRNFWSTPAMRRTCCGWTGRREGRGGGARRRAGHPLGGARAKRASRRRIVGSPHGADERPEAIDRLLHGFASSRPRGRRPAWSSSGASSRAPRHALPRPHRISGLVSRSACHPTGGRRVLARPRGAPTSRSSSGRGRTGRRPGRSAIASLRASRPSSRQLAGWPSARARRSCMCLASLRPDELAGRSGGSSTTRRSGDRIRAAQDAYAAANSYEKVAERYAEILGL